MEDRLRASLPGVILPPKPDKANTLGGDHDVDSLVFARAFAKLLQLYLESLIAHPLIGGVSHQALHEYLTYPKKLGELWNECSDAMIKRVKAKTGTITDKIAGRAAIAGRTVEDPNPDLSDMITNAYRMVDCINESSPKFEKFLNLVNDYGEASCLVGMGFSKLCGRDITDYDSGISAPSEMLALAALKDGRRLKKLSVDLQSGGMNVFVNEYSRARNEVNAFNDRKRAILATRRLRENATTAKKNYERKKEKFIDEDRGHTHLMNLENEVKKTEQEALAAKKEMDKIGQVLNGEILRLKEERRKEWFNSVSVIAKDMHECWKDRVNTWEWTMKTFEQEFPDINTPSPLDEVEPKVAQTVLF